MCNSAWATSVFEPAIKRLPESQAKTVAISKDTYIALSVYGSGMDAGSRVADLTSPLALANISIFFITTYCEYPLAALAVSQDQQATIAPDLKPYPLKTPRLTVTQTPTSSSSQPKTAKPSSRPFSHETLSLKKTPAKPTSSAAHHPPQQQQAPTAPTHTTPTRHKHYHPPPKPATHPPYPPSNNAPSPSSKSATSRPTSPRA